MLFSLALVLARISVFETCQKTDLFVSPAKAQDGKVMINKCERTKETTHETLEL